MNVAILGFGTVGSGVYDIITRETFPFHNEIKIKKIFVRSTKTKTLPIMTDSFEEIINDKNIDLIIECIGGINPAYEYIKAALSHKKSVVTANKAVIANNLRELEYIAKSNGVFLSFEASTAGGIPWLASIEKASRIDRVSHFYGILNGTTNYILDKMDELNEDFSVALTEAQKLGYAESDPSADIDGIDVKNKVVISSAIAFHSIVEVDKIPAFGIRYITKNDISFFKTKNFSIKLIGEAEKIENKYEAIVIPTLFSRDSIEANVKRNLNIVTLQGATIGELKFYGQGAGKLPTANAVVQDVLDIYTKKITHTLNLDTSLEYSDSMSSCKYYIRTNSIIENQLIENCEEYNGEYFHYTKNISINQLIELTNTLPKEIFVIKERTAE
ncbi:homoserine dehydrogenase [Fusobacterium sp. PH5-44]|uniref:homoserine dehydrogenase n=1 Tax=unclassified Fusobacterium TaxID=2648384 RepID=UPI003D21B792